MSVCSKCGLNYCGTFLSPYTDGGLCQGCRTQHDLDQAYETIKQLRSELEALRKENDEIRMLNIEVTRTNSRFCVELEAERGKNATKILAVRDALVAKDYDEAWHQLYSIADPTFTELEPWKKLEELRRTE